MMTGRPTTTEETKHEAFVKYDEHSSTKPKLHVNRVARTTTVGLVICGIVVYAYSDTVLADNGKGRFRTGGWGQNERANPSHFNIRCWEGRLGACSSSNGQDFGTAVRRRMINGGGSES
jgi:hypothetical protein